jgi:hypothetical protein
MFLPLITLQAFMACMMEEILAPQPRSMQAIVAPTTTEQQVPLEAWE